MKKIQHTSDASTETKGEFVYKSGSDMFGFSNPDVKKLIQVYVKALFQYEFLPYFWCCHCINLVHTMCTFGLKLYFSKEERISLNEWN